jgi:hypothetical protein
MKIMSSKFNRSYSSQIPDLCYDGWGLILPSTLYQELILSKPFTQLVSSVRGFVKTRDEEILNPRPTLEARKKKKSVTIETIPEEENEENDDLQIDEDNMNEEEEEEDGTLFDEENDNLYENVSTDSNAYISQEELQDESARKKVKPNIIQQ